MAAEYHFVTSWKIQGTSRVVAEGANHRWAMARGEGASKLELLRRRARTEAERLAVPAPPGPTFARAHQ